MARAPRNEAVGRQVAGRASSPEVSSLSGRRSRKGADEPAGDRPRPDDAVAGTHVRPSSGASDGRAVVTLSPAVAAATRRMGEQMGGAGATEVVRRGLILLDLLLSLDESEELVVRHTDTREVERLRFAWDTF